MFAHLRANPEVNYPTYKNKHRDKFKNFVILAIKMKSGIIVAVAVVVLLAGVGGYFYFNQASSMSDEEGCIKVVGGVVGISNECNDISECDYIHWKYQLRLLQL